VKRVEIFFPLFGIRYPKATIIDAIFAPPKNDLSFAAIVIRPCADHRAIANSGSWLRKTHGHSLILRIGFERMQVVTSSPRSFRNGIATQVNTLADRARQPRVSWQRA
jgi:hypothetical protein